MDDFSPLPAILMRRGLERARQALISVYGNGEKISSNLKPIDLSSEQITKMSFADPEEFARRYLAKNIVKCSFAFEIYILLPSLIALNQCPFLFLFIG